MDQTYYIPMKEASLQQIISAVFQRHGWESSAEFVCQLIGPEPFVATKEKPSIYIAKVRSQKGPVDRPKTRREMNDQEREIIANSRTLKPECRAALPGEPAVIRGNAALD